MKKRKSPIVLVTALAVVCSVAFGLQFASSKVGGAGTQAPPPEMPEVKPVGQPRAAESTSAVSTSIKQAIGGGATAQSATAVPHPGPRGAMDVSGPMVLNETRPAGKPEKPKPNTSATSAQWYDKDSALANQN